MTKKLKWYVMLIYLKIVLIFSFTTKNINYQYFLMFEQANSKIYLIILRQHYIKTENDIIYFVILTTFYILLHYFIQNS